MSNSFEANRKILDQYTDLRLIMWYDNKPYIILNNDAKNNYSPDQYCTVLSQQMPYDTNIGTAANNGLQYSKREIEILNLPTEYFKRSVMEMLIEKIMKYDVFYSFNENDKQEFLSSVASIVYKASSTILETPRPFSIGFDTDLVINSYNAAYIKTNTSIKRLGYDIESIESVFEFEMLYVDFIVFTLREDKSPKNRNAVIIIINSKKEN